MGWFNHQEFLRFSYGKPKGSPHHELLLRSRSKAWWRPLVLPMQPDNSWHLALQLGSLANKSENLTVKMGGGEGLNLGPGVLEGWFLKKPISFQDLCGFCWRSQRFVAFFFKSWNLYFFKVLCLVLCLGFCRHVSIALTRYDPILK